MNIIPLFSDGSTTTTSTLAGDIIGIRSCYNYSALAWQIDLSDIKGNNLLAGLMLFPNIDLLKPFPAISAKYGSLIPVEKNLDDYKNPNSLGNSLILLWYPVGEEVVIPT